MVDSIKVSEIRAKFPMYDDMPDESFIMAIRRKFYSDIPMNEFVKKIDFDTERSRVDPTKGNTFLQNAVIGTGKGLTDFARGVGQMFGLVSRDDVAESRKLDAPLMETGGGKTGSVIGQSLPYLLAPGAATIPGAVGYGALSGALSPSESTEETLLNTGTGALFGGGTAAAVKGLGMVGRAGYRVAEPHLPGGVKRIEGRTLNALAGNKAKDVISELQKNKQFVPGSQPIAGEAAVEAGSAPFSAAQELLKKKYQTTEYAGIEKAQEAARKAAIQTIGKDKPALDAAIGARTGAASSLYAQAEQGVVPFDSEFKALMARPQFREAVGRASTQAKNEGIDDIFFRNAKGQPVAMVGNGIHYIKKALDEAGEFGSVAYLGKQAAKSANSTKDEFLKIVDKSVPEYGVAKETFAKMSPPVNQMQIGQFLEQKLGSPLDKERPAMFAQALRDAPGTIKRATGGPRFDSLDAILSPQQVGSVKGVLNDLTRSAEYDRLARGGAEEARGILGAAFRPSEPPNMLKTGITIARSVLERVQGKATEKTLAQLAQDMQNPQVVAELMKAATPKERPILEATVRLLRRGEGASFVGAGLLGQQGY